MRSEVYKLRNIERVNYSYKNSTRVTKNSTHKKIPMSEKNKKLVQENCKAKKELRKKLEEMFSRLNKKSVDSDLLGIGYLFNCYFTKNPESIAYDLEKIRGYVNQAKTKGEKGTLQWENLKSIYFSAVKI